MLKLIFKMIGLENDTELFVNLPVMSAIFLHNEMLTVLEQSMWYLGICRKFDISIEK